MEQVRGDVNRPLACDELFFLVEMPGQELPFTVYLHNMLCMAKFRHRADADDYMAGIQFNPDEFGDS